MKFTPTSTPNPDRQGGDDSNFFAQHVMRDAILRTAWSNGLLRQPEGWRRSIAAAQPVKQVCPFLPLRSRDSRQ